MKIPFVDLRAQHEELAEEINIAIKEIIDMSSFIGGDRVEAFERNFALFCGARHAIACASGTDALKLALMGVGVQTGEEVITVPNTFIATIEAITMIGAHPIFVDIDRQTYNLSPVNLSMFLEKECQRDSKGNSINFKTGRRVAALIPVHLYGLPSDMKPILALAEKYNLKVVEDACQAHGATYRDNGIDKKVGTFGQAGAFSFYPSKNLGAMGEGGAVTTDKDEMDRNMRIWRDHGQSQKYIHVSPNGWNGRLDAIQCSILGIKLKKLVEWNERRRRAANWYGDQLSKDPRIVLPVEPKGRKHVYHLYVVRIPNREKICQRLSSAGIGLGLHYPIPLHLQTAYDKMGWKAGDFPEAEAAASSVLSLPMFPHISEEQVDYVCSTLLTAIG